MGTYKGNLSTLGFTGDTHLLSCDGQRQELQGEGHCIIKGVAGSWTGAELGTVSGGRCTAKETEGWDRFNDTRVSLILTKPLVQVQ